MDFITPSGGWDITKLDQAVLSSDVEVIRKIPISKYLEDKLVWHYDKLGRYTVKSGYRLFMKAKINGIAPILCALYGSLFGI